MDITLQSALLNQTSGSHENNLSGSAVRVSFSPPLQPAQAQALQGTTVQAQLAVPQGQSQPVLILPTGEQIPVKLEPMPQLPQGAQQAITLRVQSDTQAAAQILRQGTPSPASTPAPQTPSSGGLPANLTHVPMRPVAGAPALPPQTPTLMVTVTPPSAAQTGNPASPLLQTLSALTPSASADAIVPPPARIQIQPPQPLPLGTRAAVTLTPPTPSSSTTVTLNNITPPTPAVTTGGTVSAQPQPLPTVATPPLPASASGLTQLASQTQVTLPQGFQTQTLHTSFTVRAGALLPPTPQQSAHTVQQVLPLPNGQTATLQTPQALPQKTPVTVQLSQVTPQLPLATVTNISNTHAPQTAQQLPAPLPFRAVADVPVPSFAQNLSTVLTVTAQRENLITLQTPVGEKIQVQWPSSQTGSTPPPLGSQVTVQAAGDGQVQVVAVTTAQVLPTTQHVSQHYQSQWPTLSQALNLLSQGGESEALKQNVPTLNTSPANLAVQLAAFSEATKTANATKFLSNDLVNLLRQLGVDLTPDLANLSTLQNRADQAEGWRGFLFPYVENEQDDPRQGGFFFRQSQDDEDADSPKTQTRFVVQLGLSELGDIALDGIYTTQKKTSESALHVRLHTGNDWSEDMSAALVVFAEELFENLGLNGQLTVTSQPLVEAFL